MYVSSHDQTLTSHDKLNHTFYQTFAYHALGYTHICVHSLPKLRSTHTFCRLMYSWFQQMLYTSHPWRNTITRILRLWKKLNTNMHDDRYLVNWSSTHLKTIQVFDYQPVLDDGRVYLNHSFQCAHHPCLGTLNLMLFALSIFLMLFAQVSSQLSRNSRELLGSGTWRNQSILNKEP